MMSGPFLPAKLISGGQTGADRAGLDAAITLHIPYGGALPHGRRTEDGALPASYKYMTELSTPSYPARTAKNVRDADATLVFTIGKADRGSALTIDTAARYHKPCLHIDLSVVPDVDAVLQVRAWLAQIMPEVLNIAGSRESTSRGIYGRVRALLLQALSGVRR